MPHINGPASLAAYHQRQLDKERKPMSRTSFDIETMDAETEAEAKAHVDAILHPQGATQAPATAAGTAPSATTATPAPAADATKERKSRTTVAKLLQRQQEKEAQFAKDIAGIESIIASYEKRKAELAFRLQVVRELIPVKTASEQRLAMEGCHCGPFCI